MQVTVTARHIPLPPQLESLLTSKVKKLERFGHKLISLHAIFGRERYFYTAELTLCAKGITLVGRAKDKQDILTSMELALGKLKSQLRRRELKWFDRPRREVPHRPG